MKGTVELIENLTGTISKPATLTGSIAEPEGLSGKMDFGVMKVVANNYDILRNKPSINNVELNGNITSEEIGVLDVDDEITIKMINDTWNAIFN